MRPRKVSRGTPAARSFQMHWGSGVIAEEASYVGRYHDSRIQLLEYTAGAAKGSWSVRFCYYGHGGRFSRNPLMVSPEDVDGLRKALAKTPKLRRILQRLVSGR